jgi:hypothetical protein
MLVHLATLMVNTTRKRPESATAHTDNRQPVQKPSNLLKTGASKIKIETDNFVP